MIIGRWKHGNESTSVSGKSDLNNGKGTVLTLARAGDRDAIALMPYIGANEFTKESLNPPPAEILSCYAIGQQGRYEIHNRAALQYSAPNIVDLPSGYSPWRKRKP